MYGGISYTIHAGAPVGQRVSDIKVGASPLEDTKTYTICVNNYRAVGGGDYKCLQKRQSLKIFKRKAHKY